MLYYYATTVPVLPTFMVVMQITGLLKLLNMMNKER